MSKKKALAPEEKLTQYTSMVNLVTEVEIKGATTRYTSLNGHMFSFLSKEGEIGIRLSKEDQVEFEQNYGPSPFIQHNSVMKDYVAIPTSLSMNSELMATYLRKSVQFIQTLKPKPTKKAKK